MTIEEFPPLHVTHAILNMGSRAKDFHTHFLKALVRENAGYRSGKIGSGVTVAVLDTSKTAEESLLGQHPESFSNVIDIKRLDRDEKEILYKELATIEPNIRYFTESEGPLNFLRDNNLSHLLTDTRSKDTVNFSVATERLRLSIYVLAITEHFLSHQNNQIPQLVWITDDDGAIRPSKNVNGEIKFPKTYNPHIYSQLWDIFKTGKYTFSVSGFTGDLPAPLLTLNYNLFILKKIFEEMRTITDQHHTPSLDELKCFIKNVISSSLQELQETYPASLPINYRKWKDLTWEEISKELITILCSDLNGTTTPLKVATDDFPWASAEDKPFTNVVTNIELLTLTPQLPPPFGPIRGSDAAWFHTMKNSLLKLRTANTVDICFEKHPHFFHRQEIKTRPNIGKRIAERSRVYDENGKSQSLRGKNIDPTMFDDQIEEVFNSILQVPWLKTYRKSLFTEYEQYKANTSKGYIQEMEKGEVRFKNHTDRIKATELYVTKWREVCKVVFPSVVSQLENNMDIDILNPSKAPISIHLDFLKSTFRL